MPAHRLSDEEARRIVAHGVTCLERIGVTKFCLAAAHPPVGFERAYDTLELEIKKRPTLHRTGLQSQSAEALPMAPQFREALLLFRAVSCCEGYSFVDNLAFWNEALSLTLVRCVLVASRRFPRIAFDWDLREHAEGIKDSVPVIPSQLDCNLLELFRSSQALSEAGQAMLGRANKSSSQVVSESIECVVSFHFRRVPEDTQALIDTVVSAANAVASQPPNEFVWSGVRVAHCAIYYHGLSNERLEKLGALCDALPATMRVDYRFPKMLGSQPVGSNFDSFMSRAIGVAGSEFLGRLEVLDLESSPHCLFLGQPTPGIVDFACLCSMLPFSRSLRKLRVTVHRRGDLVWLAYALLHPATASTQWRALFLDNELDLDSMYSQVTPWPDFDRVVRARSPLAVIWAELQWPIVGSERLAETDGPDATGFVWRTATIDHATDFLSLDKERVVARFRGGERVELCDTAFPMEAFSEYRHFETDDNDTYVAAILRGVGAGWIRKRHVKEVVDTEYVRSPRSSLTTLTLGPGLQRACETDAMLSLCGASLLHLRVTHCALYECGDVWQIFSGLVSLEMPMVEINFEPYTLPSLPHLRYLGVIGYYERIEDCFRLMCGHPRLQKIRLRVDATYSHSGVDKNAMIRHANALIASTPSLRSLKIMISLNRRPDKADQFTIDAPVACALARKLAFLSAVRVSGLNGLLGRLDSDVLRNIFALAGPSVCCAVAFVEDVFHRPSPILWPDDWYDTDRE